MDELINLLRGLIVEILQLISTGKIAEFLVIYRIAY